MTPRRDINEANIVRQGLASMGLEDGATEGQVPAIGADGEVEFTSGTGSSSFHGAYIFSSNPVPVTDSWTLIPFDSVLYDTDGYFQADAVSPGIGGFVIPDGLEGLYRGMIFAAFDDSTLDLAVDLAMTVTLPGSTKIDSGESGTWHLGGTQVAADALGFTNLFGFSPALPMASLASTGNLYADSAWGRAKLSGAGPISIFSDAVPDTIFLTIERVGDMPAAI